MKRGGQEYHVGKWWFRVVRVVQALVVTAQMTDTAERARRRVLADDDLRASFLRPEKPNLKW